MVQGLEQPVDPHMVTKHDKKTRIQARGGQGYEFRVWSLEFRVQGSNQVVDTKTVAMKYPPRLTFGLTHEDMHPLRCRANPAQIRQSRPDSGIGMSHFSGKSF